MFFQIFNKILTPRVELFPNFTSHHLITHTNKVATYIGDFNPLYMQWKLA